MSGASTLARNNSSRATLKLLGSFQLGAPDGRPIIIRSKKNKALLAILAMSPKGIASREQLADLLWGSHGEQQARASLRQSLATLRRDMGDLWTTICIETGDYLSLLAEVTAVDVVELHSHEHVTDLEELRRLASSLQGQLLADVRIFEEGFNEWLSVEETRMRAAAIGLLERLAGLESGSRRVTFAHQLVQMDPLRESSHRTLMRAYVDSGDASLALMQFENCRKTLKSELQVDPSPETRELYDEIRRSLRNATKPTAVTDVDPTDSSVLPKEQLSIGVLPFTDIHSDSDQLFLADGISEELITNLSRFRHLLVISRSSSFAFRNVTLPPHEIGRKLGVKFLLLGTIRRVGEQLRVTAELVESESDATLWRERYDRPAADVLDILDELSGMIVASTVGQIDQKLLRGSRRKQTGMLAAYELFLKGRNLMHSPQFEDKLLARKLFEQAIELDGEFAQAWAQLANTYLYEFFLDDSGRSLSRAAELATKAMQIDEEEPWCHLVLGLSYLYRHQFDLALKHCRRAVQLNPSDPALLAKLGLVMIDRGNAVQAIPIVQKSMQLNPMNADAYSDYLALAYMGARMFREALEVLETSPEDAYYYHAWLAICYIQIGNEAKARWHGAKAMEMEPDFTLSRVAQREPLRNPADLDLWISSLRQAGVRE